MKVESGVAAADPGAVETAGCSEGEMPAELVFVDDECENDSGGGGGGAVKPGAGGRIAPNEGEYWCRVADTVEEGATKGAGGEAPGKEGSGAGDATAAATPYDGECAGDACGRGC